MYMSVCVHVCMKCMNHLLQDTFIKNIKDSEGKKMEMNQILKKRYHLHNKICVFMLLFIVGEKVIKSPLCLCVCVCVCVCARARVGGVLIYVHEYMQSM